MIPIERLLYKLDLKLNKVGSGNHQNIPLTDKLFFLNEAQIRLIKKKININNIYQVGFEGMKTRYQDLQGLVVAYEEAEVTHKDILWDSYETPTEKLTNKLYLPLEIIAIASKGKCKGRKINIPRLTKHHDLGAMMNNVHYSPSFKFQETVATMNEDNIIIYSNDKNGKFVVDKVLITYLRYPKQVDFVGYTKFDGSPSTTVNCELPEYLEDELLSLAVSEISIATGNENLAKGQMELSRNSE